MENLKFTIEDSEIAELLGRQNFSTKESAVFELVKNSFDAGAKSCDIYIEDNCIRIIDSGNGMNKNDIKNNWMHVGKSDKGYKDDINKRVLTGSKGVGRFALARLGNSVKVKSKRENDVAILWKTDWIQTSFGESTVDFEKGTHIEIYDLRDKWRSKDIESLIHFLRRAYKSEEMKVSVHSDSGTTSIESIYKNIYVGINYVTKFQLNYDSKNMKLYVTIHSDEFKPEVSRVKGIENFEYYTKEFFMADELSSARRSDDAKLYLSELGNFSAEFYFYLEKQPAEIAQKFMYKYNGLTGLKTGIALYRNDFSISSFDGTKDWLEIASRARKSPAAATHPTGSWRVRYNQIYGYVMIDKKRNVNLKDLANRQGLEEDDYYQLFVEIIQFGISRFERHRQGIIRLIDDDKTEENVNVNKVNKLSEFLKKPSSVVKMTEQEIVSLATEIKDIQREAKEQTKVLRDNEQKHKYDVRILNVLATQGLRASAIAHELKNKRNALATGYQDIVSALKEYGFWEELNSEECTRVSYKNVPKTLNSLEEINQNLIAFLDIILNKIEKKKFNSKIKSIENTVKNIVDVWSRQYNWIQFETNFFDEGNRNYNFSDDVLEVIFDNLILNSIQNNEMKDRLSIKIEVNVFGDLISFDYSDNGIGLHSKYRDDPKRILEVHETSRNDGHGLGMWIINNTLHMYGGKVNEISGDNGFKINLTLKG